MGLKPRSKHHIPLPTGHTPEEVGLLTDQPLCVFWRGDLDGSGSPDGGWCLIKGGKDPHAWCQATACDREVILPGRYDHRKPTCDACIAILERGMVPEQKDPPMEETAG